MELGSKTQENIEKREKNEVYKINTKDETLTNERFCAQRLDLKDTFLRWCRTPFYQL